jgi:hypothetical protein
MCFPLCGDETARCACLPKNSHSGGKKMLALWRTVFAISLFSLLATAAHAQSEFPETHNAALRYWLAFADLQDPPADPATAELLEKTAAGEVVWNEGKLGAILDQNETAVRGMQRATKLPDCDWGIEYDQGPSASIAYVPKARVLSRLNTLYGMRLAAKGDTQAAVDAWLSGIRFSRHVAMGGSLIFSLIAKMTLVSNLHALTQAVEGGRVTAADRKKIESAVRALPPTAFHWSAALRYEEHGLEVGVHQWTQAANPSAYYQSIMGKPAPKNVVAPTDADLAAFHKLMAGAEEALGQPVDEAQGKLRSLQDSVKTLHPFFQETTPSFLKVNEARAEVQAAREKLLEALGSS